MGDDPQGGLKSNHAADAPVASAPVASVPFGSDTVASNPVASDTVTSGTAAMDTVSLLSELRRIPVFATLAEEHMHCFDAAEQLQLHPGDLALRQGERENYFWILLQGGLRVYLTQPDGTQTTLTSLTGAETFGEVPLLAGTPNGITVEITKPSNFVRLHEEDFWQLMVTCPEIRRAILANMAQRMQLMQSRTLQREKLVSLGTLAAGLMHELNNPGAAAKRAASQLRDNLTRLQQLSLRFCCHELKPEQMECLAQLQEKALNAQKPQVMNSLEQSDSEETLAEWLEANDIENAWKLAPTLVSIGFEAQQLACAQAAFKGTLLSDSLNWLEALVGSMQMVGMIEESVNRVTDLVLAVKKYSYEDKGQQQELDVNDSIYSTLVIMAHKFRPKDIQIIKDFAPDLPRLKTQGAGLNQVWTNLLDNATDAVLLKGHIKVRTWAEGNEICVSISDDGAGIAPECQPHIFEPFYTTKPVGVGTGLGLDIVHRIVVGQYGGDIRFKTSTSGTEFTVRLPLARGAASGS